jgi:hypothetical protein
VVDIFEEGGSYNVNRRLLSHFLYRDIHHPSKGYIFALQQLGYSEKKLGAFVVCEVFALVEEIDEIGEGTDAFGGI